MGNWIHVFSGFKDIIDVLQGQLFLSTPIEDMTLRRLLRRELRDIVSQCLVKFKAGSVYSPRSSIDRFHEECPLTMQGREHEFTKVTVKQWDEVSIFSFHLLTLKLHPVVLSQAISLPTFLEFDLTTDSYKETNIYEALLVLHSEIRHFSRLNTTDALNVMFKYSPASYPRWGDTIDIETVELAILLRLLDRWVNVIEISRSLLRYLDGQPFQMPNLRPDSPIQGMQEKMEEERLTAAEVDEYLNGN